MLTTPIDLSRCIRVWLGGSFDPIHLGHLQMICHVYEVLQQTFPQHQVIAKLLPTAGSPLKEKPTSHQQRLAMLALATQSLPFMSIDTFELSCPPPVYSFDTFSHFRERYPNDHLIFIMGEDSFCQLDKWYRGFELLTLTNLWVLRRPMWHDNMPRSCDDLPCLLAHQAGEVAAALGGYVTLSPTDLINTARNHIYIDDFAIPNIASRDIRAWLRSASADEWQRAMASLPSAVYAYIMAQPLYGAQAATLTN